MENKSPTKSKRNYTKPALIAAGLIATVAIVWKVISGRGGGDGGDGGGGEENGYIAVSTTPSGANILINGTYAGTSPGSFEVSPGSYTIKARLSGYNDSSQTVTVAAGETKTVNLTLTASGGGGNGGDGDGGDGGGGTTYDFSCNQPIITPNSVPLGQSLLIQCPIVSHCSAPVQVRVRMEIAESSILPSPGNLLDTQYSAYLTVNPEQTITFSFTHHTTGAIGSKDISVFPQVAGQDKPGWNHFDDAFHVTEAGGGNGGGPLTIQLGQPRVIPEPSNMGSMVDIFCPIGFTGGNVGNVVLVKIHIAESSFLPWPGDELKVFSGYMSVTPGETHEILATWTTSGAHGSKDVTVEVFSYPGNQLLESNNFDDAFHVN